VADPLRIQLQQDSPRARYALDVLASLLGCEWLAVTEHAELTYGADLAAGPQADWDEPDAEVAPGRLPMLHRPNGPPDMLYSTYACLTAPWERVDPANEVGTPIAAGGFLARHRLLETPLVHLYAAELARLTGRTHPSPRAVVVLTHDVDEHFRHLFGIRESLARIRRDVAHFRPAGARRVAGLGRRIAQRGRLDPNDTWDEWHATLATWLGSGTFFVAAYNLFDRGAGRYDVAYDVRHPQVASVFGDLAEAGAEIGVHLSLQARESAAQVVRERTRLEEALGREIRSARHHWWALGADWWRTLRAHADAGLLVDCSFGFNDRPGFRRGITLPFRPFDPDAEETLSVWSLPTIAMDHAIFDGTVALEEGIARLQSLLVTTEAVGGALVLDWHANELMTMAGEGLLEFVRGALDRGVELQTPLGLIGVSDSAA
jgi:hypothetical protein